MTQTPPRSEIARLKRLLAKKEYDAVRAGIAELRGVYGDQEVFDGLEGEVRKRSGEPIPSSGKGLERQSASLAQAKCPSCHRALRIERRDTRNLTCPGCGCTLALDGGVLGLLYDSSENEMPPHRWLLRVGQTGQMLGEKVQLVGRMFFEGTCSEWDDEDSRYYVEPWSFEEWVLITNQGELKYIEESAEGYFLSEKYFCKQPPELVALELSKLSMDGRAHQVEEKGVYNLRAFAGEFSYAPRLGEVTNSLEYSSGGYNYSVSWRTNSSNEIEEVEFYRSQEISKLELAQIFGFSDFVKEAEREEELRRDYATLSYIPFGVAFILGVFLISSFFGGSRVFHQAVKAYELDDGLELGPFRLTATGRVHAISLSSSIQDNSNLWVGLELLNSERDAINAAEGDFWRESGYDSDGRWSEQFTSTSKYFRLENSGSYYLRVFAEGDPGKESINGNSSVVVEVREKLLLTRYFLVGALLSLGFGISLRMYRSANPIYLVVGLMSVVWFLISRMRDD